MLLPIFFSVITFLAIVLVCFAVYFYLERKKSSKEQSQRIEQALTVQASGYSPAVKEEAKKVRETEESSIRRDIRISAIPWLDTLLSAPLKDRSKSLMVLLEQSGLPLKVGEFLLLTFFISLGGIALVHFFLKIPLVGFVAGIIPFILLQILKAKRTEQFITQMPQALDMLSSDLRAGLDVLSGLKHISEEYPPPIGEEFAKVVMEVNLGLPLSEALNNLSTRVNTIDVQILCTGIIINRELGGNLSELILGVSNTIRERFRLKGMIKALTAENQMSAYLLIALPFILYFILNMLAPDTYNDFSKDPTGQKIIIGCLISMTIGYFIMDKITKLEV